MGMGKQITKLVSVSTRRARSLATAKPCSEHFKWQPISRDTTGLEALSRHLGVSQGMEEALGGFTSGLPMRDALLPALTPTDQQILHDKLPTQGSRKPGPLQSNKVLALRVGIDGGRMRKVALRLALDTPLKWDLPRLTKKSQRSDALQPASHAMNMNWQALSNDRKRAALS